MRKIINFTHATLDGYIDHPHEWSSPYTGDDVMQYLLDMHLAAGAILLGRITYEGMAKTWPNYKGPMFAHVNSIPHYVVATRPVDTTMWAPTVVIDGAKVVDEIARLKKADGGNILVWGTGQLSDALANAGLLDEYRVATYPVIKGGGEPLFRPASAGTLELLDCKAFPLGAVIKTYRPTGAEAFSKNV